MTVAGADATGLVLNVNRGAQGTVAVSHSAGAPVYSVVTSSPAYPNLSTLDESMSVGDDQRLVLETPFSGAQPAFVLIDSEVMSVTGIARRDRSSYSLTCDHAPRKPRLRRTILRVRAGLGACRNVANRCGQRRHAVHDPAGGCDSHRSRRVSSDRQRGGRSQPNRWRGDAAHRYTRRVGQRSRQRTLPAAPDLRACRLQHALLLHQDQSPATDEHASGRSAAAESFADASNLVETTPMSRDSFGNYARWDAISAQVMAGGSGPGEVPILPLRRAARRSPTSRWG